MGKRIDDEVIPALGMDSVKLRSPRGLFRLSGGHEKHWEALEKARKDARDAELARDIATKRAPGEI